jgi:glycopeptide antibiotics resistance protein
LEYSQCLTTGINFHSRHFLFDIVANMALFLPLGYLLDRSRFTTKARPALFLAAGVAFLFLLSIEWFQVCGHNRHPSPTDVFSNVTGSLIGAVLSILPPRHDSIANGPAAHSQPTGS